MTAQLPLPGFALLPAKPRRRCLWHAEMGRLVAILADERARDRQRQAQSLAALCGQLDDLRCRLADLEHAAGPADLARAPAGRDGLRRFAGGRA